jgi:hypothetical protein
MFILSKFLVQYSQVKKVKYCINITDTFLAFQIEKRCKKIISTQ